MALAAARSSAYCRTDRPCSPGSDPTRRTTPAPAAGAATVCRRPTSRTSCASSARSATVRRRGCWPADADGGGGARGRRAGARSLRGGQAHAPAADGPVSAAAARAQERGHHHHSRVTADARERSRRRSRRARSCARTSRASSPPAAIDRQVHDRDQTRKSSTSRPDQLPGRTRDNLDREGARRGVRRTSAASSTAARTRSTSARARSSATRSTRRCTRSRTRPSSRTGDGSSTRA